MPWVTKSKSKIEEIRGKGKLRKEIISDIKGGTFYRKLEMGAEDRMKLRKSGWDQSH